MKNCAIDGYFDHFVVSHRFLGNSVVIGISLMFKPRISIGLVITTVSMNITNLTARDISDVFKMVTRAIFDIFPCEE
ncbi:hypothetical protein PanWU01x14_117200 [Parasponia andersonii]|uniref:Uncharacterized protein n=1 Tax=Parasponia andersonii TaxID=3476 RepID=A0A2P5CWK7_PARAD|nr:hypothetical protein PanWU01x14_117200 [Parasponia andersonii]